MPFFRKYNIILCIVLPTDISCSQISFSLSRHVLAGRVFSLSCAKQRLYLERVTFFAKLEIFVAVYSLESVLQYKGGIQLRPNSAFSDC